MSTTTHKLISHGSVYLVGNILRRLASFVMLPIYTRYLTPEHYGTLELLGMVIDVVAILFGLRIGEAVFRFYYKYDTKREKDEVMFTSLTLVIVLNAIGVVALLLGSRAASELAFGSPEAASLIALFSFTLVLQSLTETVLTFLRAQQRPWMFVGFSTMKLCLQLGLNIFFVVHLRMAVEGVIYSNLVAGLLLALPLGWYSVRQTGFAFSIAKAKEITAFSIPLVITGLIAFYMTFGDRYFLRVFGGGLEEVGVYSLGYRFGFLLSFLVGEPFFGIWNSEKYIIAKTEDAPRRIGLVFLVLTVALVWVSLGISVYVGDVLRLMSDPAFWGAAMLVPIVLLAYIFQNWTALSNIGILLKDRTGEITIGTTIAAVLITIGYIVLIPAYGGIGAALATMIAFAGRLVWITWRAERLFPLALPWGRALLVLALGAVTWALTLLGPEQLLASLALNTFLFAAFTLVILVAPGILPAELRYALLAALSRRRVGAEIVAGSQRVPPTTVEL